MQVLTEGVIQMNFIFKDCFILSSYWNIMWIFALGYKNKSFPVLYMPFCLWCKCRKLWSYCQVRNLKFDFSEKNECVLHYFHWEATSRDKVISEPSVEIQEGKRVGMSSFL